MVSNKNATNQTEAEMADQQQLQLGVLDRCLDLTENILSYVNPLNWWRGTKQVSISMMFSYLF